jgi:hypothetical protein
LIYERFNQSLMQNSGKSKLINFSTVIVLSIASAWAAEQVLPPAPPTVPAISAADLKGDLSFLASDTLQGRYTPSPGLQVAAEFIAAQFREIGLQPAGDDDYFQTAHMVDRTLPRLSSGLTVHSASEAVSIPSESLTVLRAIRGSHIENAPLVHFASMNPALLSGVDLKGKAVLSVLPDFRSLPREEATKAYSNMQQFQALVEKSGAAVELLIMRKLTPADPQLVPANESNEDAVTRIGVSESAAEKLTKAAGSSTVSVDVPEPHEEPVTVKNVIGILPGSDPSLKQTYVLITAHYDHIGTTATAGRAVNPESVQNANDHIYNGANDDGSGTVSVVEIARVLAGMHVHPKRTLVFMTFFGEERGELGSEYYVAHPLFPLSKTVADFNLEQVGRTDELDSGKTVQRVKSLSVTGFEYSDVTGYLVRAGRQLGVRVYKDDQASDQYFRQSDNAAFADAGVPAHSITAAFDYPDYHGVGDDWHKIDYINMARVDRVIALAAFDVANAAKAPVWSAQNPKTAPFREARQKSETR